MLNDLFPKPRHAHECPICHEVTTCNDPDCTDSQRRFAFCGSHDLNGWYPACGGTEEPFRTRTGFRLLYCWQPSTGNHCYINLDTDIALSDEEAMVALGVM
jgi:hypothetical protein